LTTAALLREVAVLKELFESKTADLREVFTLADKRIEDIVMHRFERVDLQVQERAAATATALTASEQAINAALITAKEAVAAQNQLIMAQLSRSDSVSAERFERIDVQFTERDKRTEQLSLASSTAIAAALQAAKEAVGEQNRSSALAIAKSENSTTEALRQLQTLFQTASKGTDDKINDLKGRLDRGEGLQIGTREQHVDQRTNTGQMIATAVMFSGLLSVIIAIAALLIHRTVG
jgi:hypothetical protein